MCSDLLSVGGYVLANSRLIEPSGYWAILSLIRIASHMHLNKNAGVVKGVKASLLETPSLSSHFDGRLHLTPANTIHVNAMYYLVYLADKIDIGINTVALTDSLLL